MKNERRKKGVDHQAKANDGKGKEHREQEKGAEKKRGKYDGAKSG